MKNQLATCNEQTENSLYDVALDTAIRSLVLNSQITTIVKRSSQSVHGILLSSSTN
jgi:hypothetical protein